jgi:hypothetical protein
MKLVAMRLWVERAINGTNVSKAELQQIRDWANSSTEKQFFNCPNESIYGNHLLTLQELVEVTEMSDGSCHKFFKRRFMDTLGLSEICAEVLYWRTENWVLVWRSPGMKNGVFWVVTPTYVGC